MKSSTHGDQGGLEDRTPAGGRDRLLSSAEFARLLTGRGSLERLRSSAFEHDGVYDRETGARYFLVDRQRRTVGSTQVQ
jgi:hypothetical protein